MIEYFRLFVMLLLFSLIFFAIFFRVDNVITRKLLCEIRFYSLFFFLNDISFFVHFSNFSQRARHVKNIYIIEFKITL